MLLETDIQAVRTLAAKRAIAETIAIHSRGIDRTDEALLKTAYHPDATVAYGMFEGNAWDFCRMVTESKRDLPVTLHRPANVWIKLDGDRAWSESYVIAYMELPGDAATQLLIGGRYLDHHEKRDGRWKIAHRGYVLDWNINQPSTANWTEGMMASMIHGRHDDADPSVALLKEWAGRQKAQGKEQAMNAETQAREIDRLLTQDALHDLTMTYCRGVDRGDGDLLRSIWHPDATVSLGVFEGSALEFCDMMVAPAPMRKRTFHSVANEWYDIDGDRAVGECYIIGVTTWDKDGAEEDGIVGGRYLDRFERRSGRWKIAHRTFVLDWNINQPTTAQWDEGIYAQLKTRGGRAPDDPVYDFWPNQARNIGRNIGK